MTNDTTAAPSTPSSIWCASSQWSSRVGGRCHEAAVCFPSHSRWPTAGSISSARLQFRRSSIRGWLVGHSRPRQVRKLLLPDLSTDGSCSLPSSQSSSSAPAIDLCNVRGLFSLLSETCANVVASASARIAEHFRQLLEPVVPTSGTGIEIAGLGRRDCNGDGSPHVTLHAGGVPV